MHGQFDLLQTHFLAFEPLNLVQPYQKMFLDGTYAPTPDMLFWGYLKFRSLFPQPCNPLTNVKLAINHGKALFNNSHTFYFINE
jgi:hypothetical protein